MEEPCVKKQRIESNQLVFQAKAILSDDLRKPIPLHLVIVSTIENKKQISSIMLELSRCVPLSNLQHLKRVRQNEIILCSELEAEVRTTNNCLTANDALKIKDYLISRGISSDVASSLCKNVRLIGVASIPTRIRWQYEAMNKLWPCKFHPNKYLESLFTGHMFSKEEEVFHSKVASILTKLSDRENKMFGVCVDPRSNSIVAIATERTKQNPVMHCSMVLVDFVARSQNEGAWQYDDEKFHESNNDNLNCRGLPERFYKTIVDTFKEDIDFGAENVNLRIGRQKITDEIKCSNNLEKYGPYLCTGYDVYLMVEPCLMCAMALLHSRVQRIFFLEASENGALQTKLKLHTIKELNHHYEVFQLFSERQRVFNKCC